MKYIIFATLILLGCESPQPSGFSETRKLGYYTVKTINGCEYLEYDKGFGNTRVYTLTHKGDCQACMLRQSAMIDLIAKQIIESDMKK